MIRQEQNNPMIANRYRIEDPIGQGGMGIVYRGIDTFSDERVAIKVLRTEVLDQIPGLLQRFAREAEVLRQLDHPNIVHVLMTHSDYDIYHMPRHAIVMEYVGGGTLADLLRDHQQLPLIQSLRIGLELADALTRTHYLNIIHRDIKPGNVLLAPDGTPRLTDFGTATLPDGKNITETGAVLGTFAYLSPEACQGQPLDGRADIWSFGVLLYEMLAGRCPFDATLPLGVLLPAILTQPAPPLRRFRPDAPPALERLLERMLAKDPNDRIASVRQVGAELESILRSLNTTETTPSVATGDYKSVVHETSENPVFRLHNLPPQPTPFVGREQEVQEISTLLDDSACRLITLTGTGGIGKTRLALEVAGRSLGKYMHGIFFIDLASVSESDLIAPAIAARLGFSAHDLSSSPLLQLKNYLKEKHLLLVVDNVEHLVAGAGILVEILTESPQVKLLVTSREALNLQEEWVRPVTGMGIPPTGDDIKHAADFSAVQLFVERARRIRADFRLENNPEAVVKICQLVEGNPLGIELAASWLKVMTCREIAAEIEKNMDFLTTTQRNVPLRHRSLRAVFEHSWNLLSDTERAVLPKLAVFRGGFMRSAAQEVTGASLATLGALADKSFLAVCSDDGRYSSHEMVLQYAREKLSASGQHTTLAEAHARYYLQFLQHQQDRIIGIQMKDALDSVSAELENVRTAWFWAVKNEQFNLLAPVLDVLYVFYRIRRQFEGNAIFEKSIQLLEGKARTPEEHITFARLLAYHTWFYAHAQSHEQAHARYERSVKILREFNAREYLAIPLLYLGLTTDALPADARPYEVEPLLEEALSLAREMNSPENIATALYFLGIYSKAHDKIPAAQTYLEESLGIHKSIHNAEGIADTSIYLGWLNFNQGNLDSACRYFEDAIDYSKAIGDMTGIASGFSSMGNIAHLQGNLETARRYFKKSLHYWKENPSKLIRIAQELCHIGRTWFEEDKLAEAREFFTEAYNLGVENNIANAQSLALLHLGGVAGAEGNLPQASRHFEQAVHLARTHNKIPLIAYGLAGYGNLCGKLGEWQHGRRALREALSLLTDIESMPDRIYILWSTAEFMAQSGQFELSYLLLHTIIGSAVTSDYLRRRALQLLEQIQRSVPAERWTEIQTHTCDCGIKELVANILEQWSEHE